MDTPDILDVVLNVIQVRLFCKLQRLMEDIDLLIHKSDKFSNDGNLKRVREIERNWCM
jgi:hypothetical protein